MKLIGIMQGRLVPPTDERIQCFPRDRWADEFALAAQASLDCLEWIYDSHGADVNPISSDVGISRMNSLSKTHGVQIRSLCADYFMDWPLIRTSESDLEKRLSILEWLLLRCQLAGISRLILPFVDASRIQTTDDVESVCRALNRTSVSSEKTGVEIHLETSLPPDQFATLLARLPYPMIKVNYDSGNSSALGYDPRDEFEAYGSRIGSVHIKDRMLNGGTVPLGTGDTDFRALADCLAAIDYGGHFILQVARGTSGDEVTWAVHNHDFVIQQILR